MIGLVKTTILTITIRKIIQSFKIQKNRIINELK